MGQGAAGGAGVVRAMKPYRNLLYSAVCFALCLLLLPLLTNCTMLSNPMPDVELSTFEGCPDVDCVIDRLDALPDEQKTCRQPGWMEGYRAAKLRTLIDMGRLEIVRWPDLLQIPAFFGYWPYGATTFTPGKYGDLHHATVYYTDDPAWHILAHELMHVAGPCVESGVGFVSYPYVGGYTDTQKEIMKTEGVERWIDTTYYKNEDPFWHD